MANASDDTYTPGVCNIGRAERKLRWIVGWVGAVATLGVWGWFAYSEAMPAARLAIALPATVSALGFLQARARFCVKYGFGGVFSVGPRAGQTESVEDAAFRKADQQRSLAIVAGAVLVGLAFGAAGYLL